MYTSSVFGHAILIHLGRHHVAHGVVFPLPEWRKEVGSTCVDTLTSNLTRILCFPNVIQLNFSVFKFHLLSSFFLWNFTKYRSLSWKFLKNLVLHSHVVDPGEPWSSAHSYQLPFKATGTGWAFSPVPSPAKKS